MTLSTEQQMLVEQRLSNEKKSIGITYLLWLLFGGLGIHRFYLGKTGSAIGMLVLTILGVLTLAIYIGAFLLIGLGIWLIVDAFLIPGMVQADMNTKRAMIANEVNIMANSKSS
ncbi:MAG: TM2 domain-containing protein [Roseovarius sp.]|nr:TM2 domain-containing protein [Roseovarius sp.]